MSLGGEAETEMGAAARVDQWRQLAGTFRRTFHFPVNARQDWDDAAPIDEI